LEQLLTDAGRYAIRADGVVVIMPDMLQELLLRQVPLDQIALIQHDVNTQQFYDRLGMNDVPLESPVSISYEWKIPEQYKSLDVEAYIWTIVEARIEAGYKLPELLVDRVEGELDEIKCRNMIDFLRCLIYVLAVFKDNDQVWGVGRGSSCASMVLYLIGLHAVDPIKYEIPMSEFFHD
jgi:DNA polymerase III alpha subunit